MTMRNAFEGLGTESSLSLIKRLLAKFTFSLTGLRVDAGGSSVAIASGTVTTVTTVTTVGNANNVALGRVTADGMGIQMSQLAYNNGFRRNLT